MTSDWQSMDTVRRAHGLGVLVYVTGKGIMVARWDEDTARWFTMPGGIAVRPTHWMPLPEPPQ